MFTGNLSGRRDVVVGVILDGLGRSGWELGWTIGGWLY